MTGDRKWQRSRHEVMYGHYDTTFHYRDRSFAVTVINNKTIQILGNNLVYDSSASSDSIYVFDFTTAPTSTLSSAVVQYYYLKDSIYYFEHSYLGSFGYAVDILSTH